MTPQLKKAHESLETFLAGVDAPSFAPVPRPHGEGSDAVLQAILQGVNELRANAVTRHTLTQFYELQSEEMRIYVQAETAPMHRNMQQMMQNMGQLESRVTALSSAGGFSSGPNPHDSAHRQVAFVGFPKEVDSARRIEAMSRFMKEHFANMQIKHIDVSLTKDGEMSTHGFVELGSKHHVRHLMSMVKSRNLKLTDFDKVTIKFENTDIDKNRNWALKTAEELIKSDPAARGKAIEQKRSKDRGIYVGGVAAFVQRERYSKGGEFVGCFTHLCLP